MTGEPVAALASPPPGLMGPCGGAAAYRRAALEAVGGFDGEIFAYSEDLDIALRLLAEGWTCAFAPGARGIHLGSATLGLRSVRQVRIAAASRGYVLGRYRVEPPWLATEVAIAVADALLLRSPVPIAQRMRGFMRGRRLTRRAVPRVPAMGWRTAMRRRLRAAR
jgi:GT2 family glycosyltransferase